jgi:hypothetical protein
MENPSLLDLILHVDHDITRHFEFDYILFDALFLALYVTLLVRHGRIAPLRAGLVCAPILYAIDGIIWTATGVREYSLPAPWIKHPVDFMMDVSYAIVAFSWVWIAFERRSVQDVALWTAMLFAGWLLVPLASRLSHLNDAPITTIRHMRSQVWLQIVVVVAGYLLLLALRYDLRTVLYVFWVGCMLTFMMESALLIAQIRPSGLQVLAYETLILTNQGVPYVYVIWDKILPALRKRIAAQSAA